MASSERRKYVPIGFLSSNFIATNLVSIIPDAVYIFGIITSLMHMDWVRLVGSKIKIDYRYSSTLVYNTFPFADWEVDDRYNLCLNTAQSDNRKTAIFSEFIHSATEHSTHPQVLVCIHYSFRYGFDKITAEGGVYWMMYWSVLMSVIMYQQMT